MKIKKSGAEVLISDEARKRLKIVAAQRGTTIRALIEKFALGLRV